VPKSIQRSAAGSPTGFWRIVRPPPAVQQSLDNIISKLLGLPDSPVDSAPSLPVDPVVRTRFICRWWGRGGIARFHPYPIKPIDDLFLVIRGCVGDELVPLPPGKGGGVRSKAVVSGKPVIHVILTVCRARPDPHPEIGIRGKKPNSLAEQHNSGVPQRQGSDGAAVGHRSVEGRAMGVGAHVGLFLRWGGRKG